MKYEHRNTAKGYGSDSENQSQDQIWEAPKTERIGLTGAPPAIPLDILPADVSAWVIAVAKNRSIAVDYVVWALFALIGATLGNMRVGEPSAGWTVQAAIWTLAVGDPASGKSRALSHLIAINEAVEKEAELDRQIDLTAWKETERQKSIQRTARQRQVAKARDRGIDLLEAADELEPTPPPHIDRLIAEDGTLAGMERTLIEQPRGILLVHDEGGALLAGSRGGAGMAGRQLLLKGSDGALHRRSLATGSIEIPAVTIGICANIQPDILAGSLANCVADGFAARFIVTFPAPSPFAPPGPPPDDALVRNALGRLRQPRMSETRASVPFTAEATDHHQAFSARVHEAARQQSGLMAGVLGKAPTTVVRLAVILAYLDWALSEDAEPAEIGEGTVLRAIALMDDYVLPMAGHAYAAVDLPPLEAAARKLVRRLRSRQIARVSRRDIARFGPGGLSRVADIEHVIALLEAEGLIRWTPDVTHRPSGGRPQQLYDVHPAVFGPDFAGLD